jgi:dihydroxy-acid dehydratase
MSLTPAVAESLRQALATVVVVPVTPLLADGNPDWTAYTTLTRRLIDGGITVITPNGNTGEFYALSQAEARQVLETAAAACTEQDPKTEVLAGVGHDIATAIEAAEHARDHGARMIMIHQPVHPYVSREGWIAYHAAIANKVPDLGVVLYIRNERITGANIAALADRAPNVIGVKYGIRDASAFAAVARDAGIDRFTWLAGAAELTAGPAGPVPRRRPPAQPPPAGPGKARDQRHAHQLGPGMTKKPEELRSYRWFGGERTSGLRAFSHRSRMRQLGVEAEEHLGKPLIVILNTWSDINPCHMHLRQRAEQVKRGVLEAGGFPLEMPVATLSETFQKPTPMMYRNLLAMEAEELLRSYPADGAVLMGGCDKTTPALLMGAASANIPAIYVTAGPMLPGNYRGQPLGSGTDMWKFWDDARAGLIGECELAELECGIARSPGHCMTMGTASTMTSAAEALGMTLPGMASIPAVDSAHYRMAAASGRRIVAMVWEDLTPDKILTREAFEDAVATVLALGGSTNAFIHLIAMAGRAGVDLTLDDFDAISRRVPWLANIRPSGKYLMEDFYFAGGLPALLGQLATVPGALHPERVTVTGRPFGDQIRDVPVHNPDVIRGPGTALAAEGGVAVLRGNLAPDGAVIKHIAAEPRLIKHTGPAVVFDSYADLQKRINDPALNITPDSVLVLRNAGPKGGPGMPEYGMLPIPDYLLAQGVRDMVRISDARMSGTSYGACVLHVAPEAFTGGPLAVVQTGDLITLDVAARELSVNISERALVTRREQWRPPEPKFERGYGALYTEHITQANEGCDFDFLARRGRNPEPNAQ